MIIGVLDDSPTGAKHSHIKICKFLDNFNLGMFYPKRATQGQLIGESVKD
jgi:hypothetical protein